MRSFRYIVSLRSRVITSGLMLFILWAHAEMRFAQTPGSGWEDRLDASIEKGMKESHIPGLAVGIVLDGKLVYARGFGQATLAQSSSGSSSRAVSHASGSSFAEPGAPVTPDTLFHMASITKPFVATAVMQLVEEGKIDLDAPLTKYLPYFRLDDARYGSITIRQLITHTSGMPDVEDYEWNKPQYDDGALERYVRGLKNKKLLWNPGTRFAYSNIAFEVLADVIAKVSGMSFEDYIERRILKPLGMTSSTLLLERTGKGRLASGYTKGKSDSLLVPIAAYPYNRPHNASSDLMSSVNEMARWAIANLNRGDLDGKRILKDATYDVMWKPAAEVEFCRGGGPCRKTGSSVGISWFLEEKAGRLVVFHGGGDDGFITSLVFVPSRRFAFVMMTNSDSAGIPLLKQIQADALKLAL